MGLDDMKKRIFFVLVSVLSFALAACGNGSRNETETSGQADSADAAEEVTISSEYLSWLGSDAASEAETYLALGDDYCTDAYVSGEDLVLVLTDDQQERLLSYNTDSVSEDIESFESQADGYTFESADDYTSIRFSCDENMDITELLLLIQSTAMVYSLNNAICNQTEWDTYIYIINCHTGETASSGSFRYDTISISYMLWEASYYTAASSEPIYTNDDGEDVYQIRIAASYFSGISETGAQEYAEEISAAGSTYCTEAYESDGDLILEMTDAQIENYLALRDENAASVIEEFEALSDTYSFSRSEDYSSFTLSCDENIDSAKLEEISTVLVYLYGFNHALYAKTYWETYVYIVDCETGEVVSEGNARYDTIIVDDEIWE